MARYRGNGFPRFRVVLTSRTAEARECPQPLSTALRAGVPWRSIECSLHRSLSSARLPVHHRNEQVGNTRRAYLAQLLELLLFCALEQQDGAAENLALVDWFERKRPVEIIRLDHYLEVTTL